MKSLLFAIAVFGSFVSASFGAHAHETANVTAFDEEEIAVLAEGFFKRIGEEGVETSMLSTFVESDDVADSANVEGYRLIDSSCGKQTEFELARKSNLGSRVARWTYVTVMGDCILQWNITFDKVRNDWDYKGVSFKTLNGDNWKI